MSGSGISWAICKSAPCSRQITMPAPHHSVFYRPDALPATQPTASKHWRHNHTLLVKVIIIIIILQHFDGAIMMARAISRVHVVHLINADLVPSGCQPSDQVNRLGLWVIGGLLPPTSPSPFVIITRPETFNRSMVPRSVEGWVDLGTVVRVCSLCPYTTVHSEIRTWVLSHRNQMHLPLGYYDTEKMVPVLSRGKYTSKMENVCLCVSAKSMQTLVKWSLDRRKLCGNRRLSSSPLVCCQFNSLQYYHL